MSYADFFNFKDDISREDLVDNLTHVINSLSIKNLRLLLMIANEL